MNTDLQNLVTIQSGSQSIDEDKIKDNIKIKLYGHQLETVQRMSDIETGKLNTNSAYFGFGILADPVGSGKTLEMLSLISLSTSIKPIKRPDISGFNKRVVVSDRIIYEVNIPYHHSTEFIFNIKDPISSHIYGNNTFLRNVKYNYYVATGKTPSKWKFHLIKTNIIIVPHNVITHWRTTLTKYTKLKHKIISRTADIFTNITELDNYDVVVISAPRYKDVIEKYLKNIHDDEKHYYVYRFIVDEAHTLKCRFTYRWKNNNGYMSSFSGSFKINSIYIWWISSSFASLFLYNSPVNYFTPLTNMYTDTKTTVISNLTVKHSQIDINNSIQLPPKYYYKIYAELSELWQAVISNFKSIITTEALAAINADDYEEAIQRLGIESVEPKDLLKAMTQKQSDEIENLRIMLSAKKKMKYNSESYKKKALSKLEDEIAEKEHNLNKITSSIQNGEDCPICFCEPDEVKALLQCCYKRACLECLVTYFTQKYECPVCAKSNPKYIAIGQNIKTKKSEQTNDNVETDSNINELFTSDVKKELLKSVPIKRKIQSGKYLNTLSNKNQTKEAHFENICRFLNNCTIKPSILVFSSYDGTFAMCKNTLSKINMECKEIKGTPEQINKIVTNYNNQELNCLFLNSKHMGFGMNLQKTTDIIIMHKMETEMENQVIGRAYRIGKKTPLRVWYIYNQSEEEEK